MKSVYDLFVNKLFPKWLEDPKKRTRVFLALWVVAVTILLSFTAISVLLSYRLTSSHQWGIGIATPVWALFLGVAALFFLRPKVITAVFGGLLGIGASEIGTGAGLISKANKEITDIARAIGNIVQANPGEADLFISCMVWVFVLIISLICLPAFFLD